MSSTHNTAKAPDEGRILEERRLQGYFTGRRQALRTTRREP